MGSRLDSLCSEIATIMQLFSGIQWSDLKESKFTTPMTKMNTLQSDARAEGNKSCLEKSQRLSKQASV